MVVHALLQASHTLILLPFIHKSAWLINCLSLVWGVWLEVSPPSLLFHDLVLLGDNPEVSMGSDEPLFLLVLMLNLDEKGMYYSLLWCSFAYGTTFLCFQEKPSGFVRKGSISGDSGERVEVWGSPEHQREQSEGKRGNARACIKEHDRAPQSSTTKPARKVARPGRAEWHNHATVHDQAVLPGTVVPGGDDAGISCFAIFFHGSFFSIPLPLLLGFRERLERVFKTLDLAFQFTLLVGNLWRFEVCFKFKHQFTQVCLLHFSRSYLF